MRTRSLHAWLGVALALVIAVPALAGAAGCLGAASWQHDRERSREQQARRLLRAARLDSAAQRAAISACGPLDRRGCPGFPC